ncbi:large conductance mechanosensitive channel protein MscL [Mangrovimonas sp. AS39]|uniref:large conductance mechanosensitive channel protein MscL n=1 Tax=Mangrovimonas futianensis TaxID=2895523 RepID=UPI001E4FFAEC|nr:large conductance mechanosensitive channel protein MscL [Mangrovimonas futianensis]MCF1192711.1 large conductance mechanosensitive channel protein MscL [Mangrovimonas futianensis]MCF1196368.1 large conductance mechanosensitive channel protein MscL [Mangrovimonas futianensis]
MKLLKEFKEFAIKGNMMDMAIGVIIGASFNKVVDVIVKQIMLPPLSLLTDGVNFQNKKIILKEAILSQTGEVLSEEVAIGYGAFGEAILDFLVIGFTIFLVVKFLNRLREKSHDVMDKTVATPKDIELLTKLTDLMEEQNKLLKK